MVSRVRRPVLWVIVSLIFLVFAACADEKGSEHLKIGDKAPDFQLEDLNGRPFKLAEFRGRPVLIRFFVTDCKFCKADTQVFNDYYNRHKEAGLMVLYATTTMDQILVRKFVSDLAIPFPVAIDYGEKVSELYHVKIVPQTIILDSNHLIVGAIMGGVSREELDELLGN